MDGHLTKEGHICIIISANSICICVALLGPNCSTILAPHIRRRPSPRYTNLSGHIDTRMSLPRSRYSLILAHTPLPPGVWGRHTLFLKPVRSPNRPSASVGSSANSLRPGSWRIAGRYANTPRASVCGFPHSGFFLTERDLGRFPFFLPSSSFFFTFSLHSRYRGWNPFRLKVKLASLIYSPYPSLCLLCSCLRLCLYP